jgi:peroxiredoxin
MKSSEILWRWSPKRGNTLARCALAALLLGLAACAPAAPSPKTAAAAPPALALRLLSGAPVQLQDYRGQVVLLDIWATWCKPCLTSLPFYRDLYGSLKGRGFTVLAVSIDESADAVRTFLSEQPMPFPTLHDPRGDVPRALGATAMPMLFLIDRAGAIRWKHEGFERGDDQVISAEVTKLLDEKREESAP